MLVLYGAAGTKTDAMGLLRAAVERTCGLPRLPEIARGTYGKPFFPARPDIQFNLSHSGPLLLCALSDRPVGVDIEVVRPRRRVLPQRALTEKELDWCRAGDFWPRFYTLWTRRESLCKQSGRGLTLPVRDIAVPLPPCGMKDGLYWRDFSGPDWQAAVCGAEEFKGEIRWLDRSLFL